jgi:signal transduction histidine kinase
MKLLTRTIKNYLLYSVALLLICTPLFYASIQRLFTKALDRELASHSRDFFKALPYLKTDDDFHFFHLINEEYSLKSVQTLSRDTIYTEDVYDSTLQEHTPHRVLKTGVMIQNQHYDLFIRESMVSSKDLITSIMGVQTLLLVLLLCGLVLINQKLSKTVWGPFYAILDRLKTYRIDHDNPNLPMASTVEFRELTAVIEQLISKNHEAYLSQKEFTENASHELQTPLAICRTKLELLAQTAELTQEQAELVGGLLDATDRISRLNKNLLLLSKIENLQFLEIEEIELKPTILKSLEAYKHQADEKKLVITTSCSDNISIKANAALFDILVTNIISNAVRHTSILGLIHINCSSTHITIKNTGLPFEHPEKLFNRFHRESRTPTGSGLGLSIVKKIADVSNFQVSYSYQGNMHQFRVTFRPKLNDHPDSA